MVSQVEIFSVEEDSLKRAADQEKVMAGGKVCCEIKSGSGLGTMLLCTFMVILSVLIACLHQY